MAPQHSRRKFTLESRYAETTNDDLALDDVEAFLDDHAAQDPKVVSVTFEVTDPVADGSTTN